MTKDQAAQPLLRPGPRILPLDLRPRRFNQLAVFDPRGAGRFARPAVQAQVHVADKTLADREPAFVHRDHLVDAPARRIHLHAQLAIGGARVQAQAAMHAAVVMLPVGPVRTGEPAAAFRLGAGYWHLFLFHFQLSCRQHHLATPFTVAVPDNSGPLRRSYTFSFRLYWNQLA